MAATAADHNYVKPILKEDREMHIVDGRHPLQELCVPDFVPNNFEALETEKRMKILTGPNACGKSVYLKQVVNISLCIN
jgi:DNA mismatch repair protein MSH5